MAEERILIVDDEPDILHFCSESLLEEGYHVDTARRGQEALARLETAEYDLLVLDLKLPDCDGLAVLQQAREHDPTTIAVVVTAFGTVKNVIEALRAGARGLVHKPFDAKELLQAVDEALVARRREQDYQLMNAQLPILKISQASMGHGDVDTLAQQLLDIISQQLGAEQAMLLLLDEQEGDLYIAATVGLPADAGLRVHRGERLAETLILTKDSQPGEDPIWQAFTLGPESACMSVPLHTGTRSVGMLHLSRSGGTAIHPKAAFSPSDLNLLTIMGTQIATALDNARLYKAVAQAGQHWETTFDAIADLVFIHDHDCRILRANKAFADRVGLTPDELVGRCCYEVVYHSDTLPKPCLHFRELYGESYHGMEREIPQLAGTFSCSASLLPGDNGIAVHVLRDVTEQVMDKRLVETSVRQWQATFDAMGDAISLLDVRGKILHCNKAMIDLVGKPATEIVGGRYWEVVHGISEALEGYPVEQAFRTACRETMVLPVDDQWLEVVADPMLDDNGYPIGMVYILADVSERIRAEETLRRYTEQLEALRETNLELTTQFDLGMLLHSVIARAVELLGGSSGSLYLYEQDRDLLKATVTIGLEPPPGEIVLRRGEGLSGKVLESGQPIVVNDYQQWVGRSAVWKDYTFAAVVGVPIHWGDECLGVLNVDADLPRTFSSADVKLLSMLASQAAIAIHNASLYEAVQHELAEHTRAKQGQPAVGD
jgi:PAS domain S-box-containing protein